MSGCHDYVIEKGTAGQLIMGLRCYCGTTACQTLKNGVIGGGMPHPIGKFPFQIVLDNQIIEDDEKYEFQRVKCGTCGYSHFRQ